LVFGTVIVEFRWVLQTGDPVRRNGRISSNGSFTSARKSLDNLLSSNYIQKHPMKKSRNMGGCRGGPFRKGLLFQQVANVEKILNLLKIILDKRFQFYIIDRIRPLRRCSLKSK